LPVTAVPVTEDATLKTVEDGARNTVNRERLNAVVPVIPVTVILEMPATRPCAASVVKYTRPVIEPVCPVTALPVVELLSANVVEVGAARTVDPDAVNVVMPVIETLSPATRPCATLVV
jgi:hypothetical protein